MKTLSITSRLHGVAQIAMSRIEVFNSFNEQMIAELTAAFTQLGEDPKVRAIILTAEGDHFSAGADIKWMQRLAKADLYTNIQDARNLTTMLHTIATTPKLVIAEVHGLAIGGGVGLICACDVAVGTTDSMYSVAEVKLGILPSAIGPYLINAVGKRHAQRLALLGSKIIAAEAQSIGLIHQAAEPHKLRSVVNDIAHSSMTCGPKAQSEIKSLFSKLEVGPITPEVRELTAFTISRVRATEEAKEGLAAFTEKRPPSWVMQ
jgi:methylglutaconyl-CoA hydratase